MTPTPFEVHVCGAVDVNERRRAPEKYSACLVLVCQYFRACAKKEISGRSPMSRDDLHTKRWSPTSVDLPVLPRESPSGKIQTRYFPPRREISETNNSCSCSCSNSCSNLSHSWCMGEQLSYIHCWGVPQGSRSRPPASTGDPAVHPASECGKLYLSCCSSNEGLERPRDHRNDKYTKPQIVIHGASR